MIIKRLKLLRITYLAGVFVLFCEFKVSEGHLITREEFDDGAKFINDRLVNFESNEVDLRVRFLSRYNFIICAIFNPINSNDADTFFEQYLNGMLDNVEILKN